MDSSHRSGEGGSLVFSQAWPLFSRSVTLYTTRLLCIQKVRKINQNLQTWLAWFITAGRVKVLAVIRIYPQTEDESSLFSKCSRGTGRSGAPLKHTPLIKFVSEVPVFFWKRLSFIVTIFHIFHVREETNLPLEVPAMFIGFVTFVLVR